MTHPSSTDRPLPTPREAANVLKNLVRWPRRLSGTERDALKVLLALGRATPDPALTESTGPTDEGGFVSPIQAAREVERALNASMPLRHHGHLRVLIRHARTTAPSATPGTTP